MVKPHQVPVHEEGKLNVIVETPRGSPVKYAYDPKSGLFRLKKYLPFGMYFPSNFGFIPSTKAGDGDPLDAWIVMEEASYPGCLIPCRVLGAIEAEQTEQGETFRNDRVIAMPAVKGVHGEFRTLEDLPPGYLDQLERFFVVYNREQGKELEILGRRGVARAERLIRAASKSRRKSA